jgi:hypothetical protein
LQKIARRRLAMKGVAALVGGRIPLEALAGILMVLLHFDCLSACRQAQCGCRPRPRSDNSAVKRLSWDRLFFPEGFGGRCRPFSRDNSVNRQTAVVQCPIGVRHCQIYKQRFPSAGNDLLSFQNWLPFHENPTSCTPVI